MRLWHSFKKDMLLSFKGMYFYIELIMALIFIVVILFIVPENFDSSTTIYSYIDVEGVSSSQLEASLAEGSNELIFLSSEEEVRSTLAEERSSIGLILKEENGQILYEYVLQGYEHEKFRNMLETSALAGFQERISGEGPDVEIITLSDNAQKLSDRVNILPVYLTINASFMGLFIIASYIFLDKDEGVIRAFAVTPATVREYLLSKMLVVLLTAVITALLTAVAVVGLEVQFVHFFLLLVATNLFGSALGLLIASFFRTMTQAMGWLYLSVIVFALGAISYYMPAFSPWYIRILPSYPMLFAYRETFLQAPNLQYIYGTIGGFTIAGILLFLLADRRFKKTLTV